MISKDWKEFNKNIAIKGKIAEYEDDEGNYAEFGVSDLLCGIQYNELTEQQLQVAIFEQKIPKDMKLQTKEIKKLISKKEVTGKDEDRFVLVESEKPEQVYMVWFVVDGLKNITAYNNKDEALKNAKEHNEKILKVLECDT